MAPCGPSRHLPFYGVGLAAFAGDLYRVGGSFFAGSFPFSVKADFHLGAAMLANGLPSGLLGGDGIRFSARAFHGKGAIA